MDATAPLSDMLLRWQREAPRPGREVFYAALRTVDPRSLLPDVAALNQVPTTSPEGAALKRLWLAWIDYVGARDRYAQAVLEEVARSLFFLPEPHVLVGAAALARDDRTAAVRALRRAVRVDPEYQFAFAILDEIGDRSQPVVAALHRDHPVNQLLGRLRAVLRARAQRWGRVGSS